MTFHNILPEGQQVYAAGALSEIYHQVSQPLYQPYSQSLNFIALLSAPETVDISTDEWHRFDDIEALDDYLVDNEIDAEADIFERITLLHNIEPAGSAWSIQMWRRKKACQRSNYGVRMAVAYG